MGESEQDRDPGHSEGCGRDDVAASLVEVYSEQYRWRRWTTVYPELGDLSNSSVIDLGCGIGDQARDLSRLGAAVVGVDASQEAIDHAASRGIPRAHFLCDNITKWASTPRQVDGVWTSFLAAYFPQFDDLLRSIDPVLKPGGWLAITELDDLFGHRPLATRWLPLVERYYAKSLEQRVHRFRSHDHVREVLSERGWRVEVDRTLEDDEFCFRGPASPGILKAWRTRLAFMMPIFIDRFGADAKGFDSAFLECLASEEHHSESRVWFILARSPGGRAPGS